MKKVLFICAFLLLSIVTKAQNELRFEFDFACFNYDSNSVYLEFYYNLDPKGMTLIPTDKGSLIEATVHIEMKNLLTSNFFINRDWKLQNIVSSNQSDSAVSISTGVLGFVVPKGNYSLNIKASDSKNPNLTKSIVETVRIQPYLPNKYSVSDIQLATSIKTEGADSTSIFYKNTVEVFPNPAMVYTYKSPALFYYAELYNLKLADANSTFSLQKNLYNSSGKIMYKTSKIIKQAVNAVVDFGVINLSKYPTDSYLLKLSLIDPATNRAVTSEKRFYLHNPKIVDDTKSVRSDANILGSEYQTYSAEECDRMFEVAKYIATNNEKDRYKKLDSLKAKQEFLFYFWKVRDTNTDTPINEYKEEYMKRVEEANATFSRMKKEGYKTDKGRVLLMYGTPDQKDYYPNDKDKRPYEIWFYNNIEGGVKFIFADVLGFGEYILVHSEKRDEVKDENWESRITITPQ